MNSLQSYDEASDVNCKPEKWENPKSSYVQIVPVTGFLNNHMHANSWQLIVHCCNSSWSIPT